MSAGDIFLAREQAAARTDAINRSLQVAATQNPDERARIEAAATRLGVPNKVAADLIARRPGDVDNALSVDVDRLIRDAPGLSDWLADPKNASVSRDDVDRLIAFEQSLRPIQRDAAEPFIGVADALAEGTLGLSASTYWLAAAYGLASPEDAADAIARITEEQIARQAEAPSFARRFQEATSGADVDRAWDDVVASIKGATARLGIAGVRGAAGELGNVAGASGQLAGEALDFVAGALSEPRGFIRENVKQAANSAPSIVLGAAGAGLGGPVGLAAGSVVGEFAVNAGERLGELAGRDRDLTDREQILAVLRDDRLMESFRAEAHRKGLGNAAVGGLFSFFGGKALAGAAKARKGIGATLRAGAKDVAVQAVGESAEELGGQLFANPSTVKFSEVMLEGILSGGQSTATTVTGAAARGARLPELARKALPIVGKSVQAQNDAAALKSAGEALKESRTATRSPERTRALIDVAAGEEATEVAYVDRTGFEAVAEALEVTPTELASDLLGEEAGPAAYAASASTGTLAIPTADYIARVATSEYADALLEVTRIREDGPTLKEAENVLGDLAEEIQARSDETTELFQESTQLAAELEAVDAELATLAESDGARDTSGSLGIDTDAAIVDSEAPVAADPAGIADSGVSAPDPAPAFGSQPEAASTFGPQPEAAPEETAEAGTAAQQATDGTDRRAQLQARRAAITERLAELEQDPDGNADADLAENLMSQAAAELSRVGFPAREARLLASFHVRMLSTVARRFGVSLERLAERFPVTFIRALSGDADAQAELAQTAFHGSPHRFDQFSTDAIGTGEGAQAFGWGLYFADRKDVAESYRVANARETLMVDGEPFDASKKGTLAYLAATSIASQGFDNALKGLSELRENVDLTVHGPSRAQAFKTIDEDVAAIEALRGHVIEWRSGGATFTVDLAPAEDDYLLWDAPLSEQSEKVQAALRGIKALEKGVDVDYATMTDDELVGWLAGIDPDGDFAYDADEWPSPVEWRLDLEDIAQSFLEEEASASDLTTGGFLGDEGTDGPIGESIYRQLVARLGAGSAFGVAGTSQEAASKALAAAGIPGIKYLDGGSRAAGDGTFNYVIFDADLVEIVEMEQRQQQGEGQRQGGTRFDPSQRGAPSRAFDVAFYEGADRSTFFHELGHVWLEMLGDLAADDAAPDRMRKDHAALLDWFGVESADQIETKHHERWARAFELYLAEGKVPVPELRGLFSMFADWLVAIYRDMRGSGTAREGLDAALKAQTGVESIDLSDDIREVMDRLVASDEEIAAAAAESGPVGIFGEDLPSGRTAAEEATYQGLLLRGRDKAREVVIAKLERAARAEKTEEFEALVEEETKNVRSALHERPEAQALALMRDGTLPDGSPLPDGVKQAQIARETLVEFYGEGHSRIARAEALGIVGPDGASLDSAAEAFGFPSGHVLLTAMMRLADVDAVADRIARRRVALAHPDLVTPAALKALAKRALRNGAAARAMLDDLESLKARAKAENTTRSRASEVAADELVRAAREGIDTDLKARGEKAKADRRVDAAKLDAAATKAAVGVDADLRRAAFDSVPTLKSLRAEAKARIDSTPLREIKPNAHLAEVRRQSRLAAERARVGAWSAAAAAQRRAVLNHALYEQAVKVMDELAKGERFAKRLRKPTRQRLIAKADRGLTAKAASAGYLPNINTLMARFGLINPTNEERANPGNLAKWVEARMEESGVPEVLHPDEGPLHIVDERATAPYRRLTPVQFRDLMEALKALDRMGRESRNATIALEGRNMDEVRAELLEQVRQEPERPARVGGKTESQKTRERFGSFFGSQRKLAFIARRLDGGDEGGAWWTNFVRILNAAQDAEVALKARVNKAYIDIEARHLTKAELRSMDVKQHNVAGLTVSLNDMILVALNWGSNEARQRLRDGGLGEVRASEAQIQAIIDGLERRHWDYIEAVWELTGSLWPEIEAKQRRVYGVAPKRVEEVPIQTSRFGTIQGRYYPLSYEGLRAHELSDEKRGQIVSTGGFSAATTNRGYTQSRLEKLDGKVVLLSPSVLQRHFTDVIHDVTHHEALIDVGRILRNAEIRREVTRRFGEDTLKQMDDAVLDVAAGDGGYVDGVSAFAERVRSGVTYGALAFSIKTALLQPLGVTNAIRKVGAEHMGRALIRLTKDPSKTASMVRQAMEASPLLRHRQDTWALPIRDERDKIAGTASGRLTALQEHAFDLIGRMQLVADVWTWWGAYERAIAVDERIATMDPEAAEARAIALADQTVKDTQGSGLTIDQARVYRDRALRIFTTFGSFGNILFNLVDESVANARRTARDDGVSAAAVQLAGDVTMLLAVPAVLTSFMFRATGFEEDDDETLLEASIRETLSMALGSVVFIREATGAIKGFYNYSGPAGSRFFAEMAGLAREVGSGDVRGTVEGVGTLVGMWYRLPTTQMRRTARGAEAILDGETRNPLRLLTGPER